MEPLPDELGPLQDLAAALQVRFRAEVAGRHFDDALRTAKTMFALARHLGEHPTEVANLVGLWVAHLSLGTLEEMVQQPGCPNLYWALTDLPCPLVDLRKGVQGDRTLVAADLRSLRDDAPMTEAEIEEFVSHLSGVMGFAREQAGQPPRSVRARLQARVKDPERVRAARQRLVEAGYGPDLVKTFPPTQVILLDEKRDYEIQRDERMKLLALPLWQIDSLVGGKERASDGDGLFADLLPHIIKLRRTQGRLEQQIALLRHVEALRLLRRGARRQAAREAVRHLRAAARRPGHRQAVRLHGRGSDRPHPRQFASGRGERPGIQRPLRGDSPEVIDTPLEPVCSLERRMTPRCRMTVTFPTLDQIDPAEAWQPWQPTAADPWGRKWAAHLYRRAAFGASREDLLEAERLGLQGTLDLLCQGRPHADRGPGNPGRCRPHRRRGRRRRRSTPRLVALLHAPGRSSAPREDDPVLAQPLRHQPRQGAEPDPDVRPELPAAQARPGPIRPIAPGDQPGRGHAGLARFQQQRQGEAERELRPRADGAVQPGRRPLQREGHPRGRPRLHRLADRRQSASRSTPASTTAGPRPSWAKPAPGMAATWCASCSSSRRRPASWSASSTTSSSARKPCRPTSLLEPLCESFRKSDYDIAGLVRTILASRHFYSDHAFRQRVKGPVEYVLGAVQAVYRRYGEEEADYRSLPQQVLVPWLGCDGAAPVRAAERQGLAGRPVLAEYLDGAGAR